MRRGKIISVRLGKLEELICHHDAYRVHALIICVGVAATITKEPCDGVLGTDGERTTENVVCHDRKKGRWRILAMPRYEKGRPLFWPPYLKT